MGGAFSGPCDTALGMLKKIDERIAQGNSDDLIVQSFVQEYGQAVLTEPPHSGSWDAWLDGYGTTHTDSATQTVTIPATATAATLSFWLHIDTAETRVSAPRPDAFGPWHPTCPRRSASPAGRVLRLHRARALVIWVNPSSDRGRSRRACG